MIDEATYHETLRQKENLIALRKQQQEEACDTINALAVANHAVRAMEEHVREALSGYLYVPRNEWEINDSGEEFEFETMADIWEECWVELTHDQVIVKHHLGDPDDYEDNSHEKFVFPVEVLWTPEIAGPYNEEARAVLTERLRQREEQSRQQDLELLARLKAKYES